MATLHDALGQASSFIQEEVTAIAVSHLKEESKKVIAEVQEFYELFFKTLLDDVVNSELPGYSSGTPGIFQEVGAPPWAQLSDRGKNSWMDQKDRAWKKGDHSALDFYQGLTTTLSSRMTRKGKRGRFRKTQTPFHLYISTLASDPTMTATIFGPVQVEYSLARPDKGKVVVSQVGDIVDRVKQWDKKGFAKALDGTVLTASVKAFPRLDRIGSSEEAVVAFLAARDPANKNQWLKVSHGARGSWKIRPIITPLIQWYLQVGLQKILSGRFK